MTPSERLAATYNLDGILVHRPHTGTFGKETPGEVVRTVCSSDPLTATGFELATSIALAQRHVAQWQEAIKNMQDILDNATPYVAPPKT